jgi:putative DNA primase/helicase
MKGPNKMNEDKGKTLGEIILAGLMVKPRRIESFDFMGSMFQDQQARDAFGVIAREWEERRPETISPVLIRAGGHDGNADYLAGLMGYEPIGDDAFGIYYRRFREEQIKKSLVRKLDVLARSKADVENFDIEELRPELAALERLKQNEGPGPPLTVFLSSVEPQMVEWLWPNFIPLARASMISGDPNVGKTWLALDIAARLSRGLAWPDGSPGAGPANVIYVTVEDNPADTIRPRIDSLGGDPSRIAIIDPGYSDFISFARQDGIKKLEAEILKIGNVRLVVLDPVLDFSGGINPNAAEQVRGFLTPLIHLAEKLNLALVLIAHLNKAQSQSAIYRTGGSTSAWLGKCRAAFMIFRDNEEKKKRYVSAIKSNLSADDPPQLSFIPDSGRLLFEKVIDEVNVDEQLNPQFRGQVGEREESSFAVTWLKETLEAGALNVKEIKPAALDSGISKMTLYRAAHKLNLVMKVEGFGKFKSSTWALREEKENAQ